MAKNDYRVRLILTETYKTFVCADNEEQAKEEAINRLNNGELMLHGNYLEVEVDLYDAEN